MQLDKQCKNAAQIQHEIVKNVLQEIAIHLVAIGELHNTPKQKLSM